MSNVGIIYSTDDKSVLSYVIPDNDAQLIAGNFCGPNQALYVLPKEQFDALPPENLIPSLTDIIAAL